MKGDGKKKRYPLRDTFEIVKTIIALGELKRGFVDAQGEVLRHFLLLLAGLS